MASQHRLLCVAAVLLLISVGIEARLLLTGHGKGKGKDDVKHTEKVYNDINGGVPPLEERIAAAKKKWAPTAAILEAEAECKHNNDLECTKVKELKEKAKAAPENDDYAEEEKPKEKQTAPCNQSIFWSYFLGTTCLPTTPYDVRPPPKKDDEKDDANNDADNDTNNSNNSRADSGNNDANNDTVSGRVSTGVDTNDANTNNNANNDNEVGNGVSGTVSGGAGASARVGPRGVSGGVGGRAGGGVSRGK